MKSPPSQSSSAKGSRFARYISILLLGLFFSVLITTFHSQAYAQGGGGPHSELAASLNTSIEKPSTTSVNPGDHIEKIMAQFEQAVGAGLKIKFWQFAKDLFYVLALIEFAWACSELALSGKVNLQAVTAMIARQAIVIGICYMILTNGMIWLGWIVNGLRDLGQQASGQSSAFSPALIFQQGAIAAQALWAAASGVSESLIAVFSIIVINITFAAAATLAAIAVIQSYFVIAMGLFFLGLGGARWTRDSMTGALRHTMATGVKLMTMAVLTGVLISMLTGWVSQLRSGGYDSFGGVLNACILFNGTAVVFFGLLKALPDYMATIAGVSIAGSSGLDALVGGAAGAAMGAAGPQVFGRAAGGLYGGLRGGIDAARSGGGAKDIFKASASGSLSGLAGGVAGVNRKFQAMPPSGNGMGPGK